VVRALEVVATTFVQRSSEFRPPPALEARRKPMKRKVPRLITDEDAEAFLE
jgi:hypothetical protein